MVTRAPLSFSLSGFRSWGWILSISAVVLLGAILRFAALTGRGLIYWDEGKFALEGIRLLSVMRSLPHVHAAGLAGKAVGTAKPTHALLIALSYGVFGIHDYAPLLLNATAGVLGILVLFFVTRRLFDTRLALIAAAILAVSGYDIIYARSALSESDANLIFLLAVLLWLGRCLPAHGVTDSMPSAWLPRFGGGVLLGLAFTANYRLSIYIGTLLVIDVILLWRRCGWRRIPAPVTAWAIGGALAPVAWMALGRLAETHGIILFRGEVTYRPTSYLAEVLYQIHGGNHPGGGFGALPYAQWYVARQGWPCTILLAVGLCHVGIKRDPRMLIPAAFVVIPYVVYAFAPFIVPRNLEATIPFSAIIAAVGLQSLAHAVSPPRRAWLLLAMSVGLVTGVGVLRAWPIVGVQSGFIRAAKYVERHEGRGALVSNEVMLFYFRDTGTACDAVQMPTTARAPAIADRFEYEYAVVDAQSKPFAQYLDGHARRVAQYPVLGVTGLPEDLIRSENGHPPRATSRGYVTVYWLDTLTASAAGAVGKRPTCSLDRLA